MTSPGRRGSVLATVDRVLNARPGVREKTVRRVRAAVEELGYVRDISAANLARQRRYRFAFLLPDGRSQFLKALAEAVTEASGLLTDRSEIEILRVDHDDPQALVRISDRLARAGIDGVAIMANETPMVRDQITRLKGLGIAVVALVTDQPVSDRDHFVGIDNTAAGRTAGMLLGRFAGPAPGKVAVVVNSTNARDMVERRIGFDAVLQDRFPNLAALPSVEGRDDHEMAERVTGQCLDAHGDVVALYAVGAGLRGITEALQTRDLHHRIVVICHDLTPHSRAMLEDGTVDAVINQNAGHLARSALRVLRARTDGTPVIASQEAIRIEIVIRENLP